MTVYSRLEESPSDSLSGGEWTRHASGVLCGSDALIALGPAVTERVAVLADERWPPTSAEVIDVDDLYDRLAGLGLEYGPAFQGLRAVWQGEGEVFAEVCLSEDQRDAARSFGLHPALLDAALHTFGAALPSGNADVARAVRLPFSFSTVKLRATGAASLRVRLSAAGPETVSLVLADEAGGLIASIDSLVMRELLPSSAGCCSRP